MLLSSKAFVQIIINPVIGIITKYSGYQLPLFFGTVNMLVATLCKYFINIIYELV